MPRLDDLRLRQLDAALSSAHDLRARPVPKRGWVRTIREALGMTLQQLASRANLSINAIANVERTEAKGTIKLETLRRIADAMDCELVYAVVPRGSLRKTVEDQARKVAQRRVGRVADSMALEEQSTSHDEEQRLVDDLMSRLLQQPGGLWDE